jgi:hypothetical protein
MVKKNSLKKFNISNKLAYTLIAIFSFIFVGVGVYAYGTSTNMHIMAELSPPSGCAAGQVLSMASGGWGCIAPPAIDNRFTLETRGLCYTSPASCTITSEYCSRNEYPTSVYISSGCDSWGQDEINSMCYESCAPYDVSCNGYDPTCNSGTQVYWTVTGYCSSSYYLQCTCSASQYYIKSTYTPAGTRCI